MAVGATAGAIASQPNKKTEPGSSLAATREKPEKNVESQTDFEKMKFEAMKTKMMDKMKEDLENLGRKYTEATRGHSGDREVEEGVRGPKEAPTVPAPAKMVTVMPKRPTGATVKDDANPSTRTRQIKP